MIFKFRVCLVDLFIEYEEDMFGKMIKVNYY